MSKTQIQSQITWKNEKRKLGELVPAEYNPRKLSDKQYEDIKKSLEKFNLAEIPAINTNNTILAGHQRVKIMVDLYGKDYEIDVRVPNRKLTLEEEKEYNIRSNKNTGSWDWDKLEEGEFVKLELIEWGFTDSELSFGDIKNPEVNTNDLSDTGVIKFSFGKEDYFDILQDIADIQKTEALENNEEVLRFLIDSFLNR